MSSHIVNGKMTWDIYRKCACGGPIMRKDKKVKKCLGCLREESLKKTSASRMPTFGGNPHAHYEGWE